MIANTAIALNRFGLGARPSDAAPSDPRTWLLDQFGRYQPRPAPIAAAPGSAQMAMQLGDYLDQLKQAKQAGDPKAFDRKPVQQAIRQGYLAQVSARVASASATDTPFVERLVHFWANHFAVSVDKLVTIGLAGTLEFEAVRPHVLGKFSDMLLAVEKHPAMLLYLDQAQSIGPDSRLGSLAAGRGRKIGLNENLAREIMELHTLGVRTGYSQADVTEFARAMTGWTVAGIARGPAARFVTGAPGKTVFVDAIHEPGSRTVLGKRYGEGGEGQSRAILLDLAANPATATHVATKLARHFVADDPPPALVQRLADIFTRTGGDLPKVYRALVEAPESWAAAEPKFKSPWDWTISALRGLGLPNSGPPIAGAIAELGQPVWKPGSPAGWADTAGTWAGPDAVLRRVEFASRLAQQTANAVDARALAEKLLPGVLSDATKQSIARADSPGQGLALLLSAPEFQRR